MPHVKLRPDALLKVIRCFTTWVRSFLVRHQRRLFLTRRVRSTMTGRVDASAPPLLCAPPCQQDRTLNSVQPESGHFSSPSPVIGQIEPESTTFFYNWSDAGTLSSVTSNSASGHCLTVKKHLLQFTNFSTLAQMCQPPSVSPCARVLAYFHKHFQEC